MLSGSVSCAYWLNASRQVIGEKQEKPLLASCVWSCCWSLESSFFVWVTLFAIIVSTEACNTKSFIRLSLLLFPPSLQFHRTEKCAVSASEDGTARVWDLSNSRCIKVLEGQSKKNEVLRACWAPPDADSQIMLATGSADGTVRLWGSPDAVGEEGGEEHNFSDRCASLKVIGQLRHRDRAKGLDGQVYSCQFVRDGRDAEMSNSLPVGGALSLLTASDSSMHLWDVETRQRKASRALPKIGSHSIGGERNPDDLPFIFDAKPRPGSGISTIAVALSDGTVRVGDIIGGGSESCVLKQENSNTHLTGLAWSKDGRVLVSCAGDGTVTVWEARTWTARSVLCGHSRPVYGATFCPDTTNVQHAEGLSQLLLTWSSDETICTWDVGRASERNVSPLATLRVENGFPILHCAVSANGDQLAVAGGGSNGAAFIGIPIKLVDTREDVS